LERTFHLIIRSNIVHQQGECDWFIEPEELSKYSSLRLKHVDKLYEIGYNYVMENRPAAYSSVS
jgi:hypothetical protein